MKVYCKNCKFLDDSSLPNTCKLNPVLPNNKIYIHRPHTEWCGQGKENEVVTAQEDVITEIKKRGRPKKEIENDAN